MSDQVRSIVLHSEARAPWIVSVGIGWNVRAGLIQDRESDSFLSGSDDSSREADAEARK